MTKIVCDICGKDIKDYEPYKLNLVIDDNVKAIFSVYNQASIDNIDLCARCASDVEAYIDALKKKYRKG